MAKLFLHLVIVSCSLAVVARSSATPPTTAPADPAAENKAFWQDIQGLRELGQGTATKCEAVRHRTKLLRAKYPTPERQGKVLVEAVHLYALSGLLCRDTLIALAKEAEPLPLSPLDRAQLYLSWGDALQMSYREATGEARAGRRREAAEKYFRSLRAAVVEGMMVLQPPMAEPPRPPGVGELDNSITVYGGLPPDVAADLKRRDEDRKADRAAKTRAFEEARARWEFERELCWKRDFARDHIAEMYSTPPLNKAELASMAKEILTDATAVDQLLQRVETRVKERGGATTRASTQPSKTP